jgi:hypothetical protein
MRWNRCTSAVGVSEKVMAAFGTKYLKTYLPKGFYKMFTGDNREIVHAVTTTR